MILMGRSNAYTSNNRSMSAIEVISGIAQRRARHFFRRVSPPLAASSGVVDFSKVICHDRPKGKGDVDYLGQHFWHRWRSGLLFSRIRRSYASSSSLCWKSSGHIGRARPRRDVAPACGATFGLKDTRDNVQMARWCSDC